MKTVEILLPRLKLATFSEARHFCCGELLSLEELTSGVDFSKFARRDACDSGKWDSTNGGFETLRMSTRDPEPTVAARKSGPSTLELTGAVPMTGWKARTK